MKKLNVQALVDHFNYEVLAGKNELEREIKVYGINRAGLELSGFYPEKNNKNHRVILLSTKEQMYVQTLSKEIKIKRYKEIMQPNVPVIILTEKFTDELLVKVAQEIKFPVLKVNGITTTRIYQLLLEYFDNYFAPTVEEHASLINVFGKGVLLKGKSGIGKSEMTLELIKKNHLFVGDDRILIYQKNNKLYGKSHEILQNLIEVRGIGILDLSKIYGSQILLQETAIDLITDLIYLEDQEYKQINRLGAEYQYSKILDTFVPTVLIPVTFGRNISELVETAVAKLKLEETGVSSAKVLIDRLKNNLLK